MANFSSNQKWYIIGPHSIKIGYILLYKPCNGKNITRSLHSSCKVIFLIDKGSLCYLINIKCCKHTECSEQKRKS